MDDMREQNTIRHSQDDDVYEVSLLDLLVILTKQRWFVAKVTFVFAVLAVVYSLAATPVYKSTMQIMPPGGGAKSGAAAMLAATGMGDLLGSGALATTSDLIVGVTKSDAVLDRVIDSNKLLTRKPDGGGLKGLIRSVLPAGEDGEPQLRSLARKSLGAAIQSAADKKSGIITVSVSDVSPEMSAKLAQSVFDETLNVMQDVAITPTAQQRVFLEEQIDIASKELTKSEKALVAFQRKTGMMGTGGAASSASALASLQARMVAKEIELKAARRFAKEQNPQIKRLEAEYSAIKKQFEENQANIGTSPLSGTGVKKLPEASVEYADIVREYKFRESLLQEILRQYETAKINEANDPLVIQLLSPPTVPELRDSPKRSKICILATLLGCFLGIFAAFIRHFMSLSSGDPETAPKINYVKEALLGDLRRFRRGGRK